MLLATSVFAITLVAIITRPRGISEAWSAAAGAGAMIAVRIVDPMAAAKALIGRWDLFLFLLGLMLIAGLADGAGFFDAAGALAAGVARGSGRLLLLSVFGAGALITAFLSNDATALILTPVVYSVVTKLRLEPLPYLFATTFVADTASTLLPVSNPINVLIVGHMRLPLAAYAQHVLPAAVGVILINAAVFLLVFRRQTARRFDIDWRRALTEAIPDRGHLWLVLAGLVAIAAGYLTASAVGIAPGLVAIGGALLLAALGLARRRFRPREVREHVSVSLLVYVAGLMVLVQGVENVGVTSAVVGWLVGLGHGPLTSLAAGVLGAALASNLVNNLSATLFLLSGSQAAHLPPAHATPFLLGTLAGADLGPNLTPVGSLSTMLWLIVVRRRGIVVSNLDYLKLGAITTPLLLVAAWALIAAGLR